MPKIDVTRFMEQSGMRKARFGGYEPDDVRAALQALCTEYEQRLGRAEAQARKAEQENAALQQHCQTLTAQNNRLSGQNAALAGSSSTYSRQKESLDAQVSALQERNHSLNDQVAVLRLKNGSLQKEKEKLQERADQAEAALRIKGRELDDARNALENGKEEIMQEARQKAEDIVANAHVRADQIKEDAQAEAQAMDVSARAQAKAQVVETGNRSRHGRCCRRDHGNEGRDRQNGDDHTGDIAIGRRLDQGLKIVEVCLMALIGTQMGTGTLSRCRLVVGFIAFGVLCRSARQTKPP